MTNPEAELAAAMARLHGTVTPQTAHMLQATENFWREIDAKWGLLTSQQVAELLTGKPNTKYTSRLRSAGKIIGFRRNGRFVHPGFQFDHRARRVRPVIPALIELANEVGYDAEDVTMSLAAPSTYWKDDTPTNHLDEPDFLSILRQRWTVEW